MAANVKFLIFAHGNILSGEEGASYDREPLRKIRVKTDASYEDLLNAIRTKVDIDLSAHQIQVFHRHPKSVGERVHHYLVPIQDDSDVEDLTVMAEKMGDGSIQELYLEISNRSIGLSEHETRQVDPSQNLMIYKLCDPTAFPMPPSPMLMDTTTGMVEGNQTSRASSSTTPPHGQDYEVFLSFRGIDTRHGFTDHLYNGLINAGVWVFRDNEELHVGEEIGSELLKAIKGSRISIPIISKNYASSTWCLKELVQILKCMKTLGQVVLPIFYQVEPFEVRNQKGEFGKGFLLSEKKHDAEGRLVQDWKNALMEVASLKAWESSKVASGHEGELIQIVVRKVLQVLQKVSPHVSNYLVGVEDHVEKIIEWIATTKGSSDVHAIAIHGMGGIGKTTLAKVVYNQLCNHFECCSFVADIRAASQSFKGMEALQMQLISQILGQKLDVLSIDEGAKIIKNRCNRKKALIVLDDIDHGDQLNALAGKPDWFGGGTLIIITSRRKDILKKWEGSYSYELNGLDSNQSFILFCKHAFKSSDSIPDEYKAIAMEILSTTGGLPLAIEVIGSLLYGNVKDFWEANLKMLKEIPHDEVQRKLKISFDALNQDEKEIFLDIACLPIRRKSELAFAFYMWDSRDFKPQVRIEKLISLSLIKIGDDKGIIIHDQLRDLGREIIRQEDMNNLGKRSRLWKEEEAQEVLESKQGTPNVQALSFRSHQFKDANYTSQQFEGMECLKFLHMDEVQLTGNFDNLFLNLRWLWWHSIRRTDIVGINFKPKRLVVLQLYNCNVTENWTGWSEMKYLKVLELRLCYKLNTTPDFSAMELDVLVLSSCSNLREIDSSIGKFSKSLKVLNVYCCRKLKELPKEVGKMEELRELNISWTRVRKIPIFEGYLTKLETLSARKCCMLMKLPKSIGKLELLTELDLYESKVTKLPDSIGKLHKLQKLDLWQCAELREIPKSIGNLKLLTKLDLSWTRVTQLPDSVGDLYNLEKLSLWQTCHCGLIPTCGWDYSCPSMKTIPKSIGKLKLLTELELSHAHITQLPPSIGDLRSLKRLSMHPSYIKYLPTSIGKLTKLQQLNLGRCPLLKKIPKSIGKLKSLTMLDLRMTGVTRLPDSIGGLYNLEQLFISHTCIKCLPTSIAMLTKLQRLDLEECKELESLPNLPCSLAFISFNGDSMETLPDFSNLTNLNHLTYKDLFQRRSRELNLGKLNQLKELHIHESKLRIEKDHSSKIYVFDSKGIDMAPEDFFLLLELPLSVEQLEVIGCQTLYALPNLSTLKNLFRLRLQKCSKLREINGLEGAELLINLHISGCHPEIKIPDLSVLRNLKTLKITNDRLMEILGLQELKSLEILDISECKSLNYLPDLSQLAKLQFLGIRGCTKLRRPLGLPNVHIELGYYHVD